QLIHSHILPRPTNSTLLPYTTLFRSLYAFGQRRTLDHLHRVIQQVPTIQHWHRQQVEHAKAHADDGQEPEEGHQPEARRKAGILDRKSTRLNSSHQISSYAVFCLKTK